MFDRASPGAPDLTGRRVLVTGGSGFIGRSLVAALTRAGAETHALGSRAVPPPGVAARYRQADLRHPAAARAALDDLRPDLVYHLASVVSGARGLEAVWPTLEANLLAAVHLLLAATERGTARVVLTGSLEEPDPVSPVPASPYAAAKGAAAAYADLFHALYATPVVQARLYMVYGPGQSDPAKLVPYVIGTLLRGQSPRLSSGTRPVDWIYVDDVVDGLLRAGVAEGVEGKTLELGTGELTTVRAVVEQLGRLVDPGLALGFGSLPDRPNERVRAADPELAGRLLSWRPGTTLERGLAATVAWFRAGAPDLR